MYCGISEKWDPGPRDVRTRDPGLGARDPGLGTRDSGLGTQNFLFTMQTSPYSIVIEKKRKI